VEHEERDTRISRDPLDALAPAEEPEIPPTTTLEALGHLAAGVLVVAAVVATLMGLAVLARWMFF
jgi:hypothetical protein